MGGVYTWAEAITFNTLRAGIAIYLLAGRSNRPNTFWNILFVAIEDNIMRKTQFDNDVNMHSQTKDRKNLNDRQRRTTDRQKTKYRLIVNDWAEENTVPTKIIERT